MLFTEGAGGGHAPDIIKICGEQFVLPSSTVALTAGVGTPWIALDKSMLAM